MPDRLIADIGGTHSRLALADRELRNIRVYDNADFNGIEEVLQNYLQESGSKRPISAALAVAAPVGDDRITLINLGWSFSIEELRVRFGFDALDVVNDFAAIALAVPVLGDDGLKMIKQGSAETGCPVAVLGPGTGLGVSALVPSKNGWIPVAGEGGHVTLAPATDEESRIIDTIRAEFGHVSAERLVSGPGLLLLYRVISGNSDASLQPEAITRLAIAGEDAAAVQTLDLFLAMLGTVAGNLALTLGARGGVYLAGGILPKLGDDLDWSRFIERFLDKGRYRSYMEAVPVFLITAANPALLGLADYLSREQASSVINAG